MQFYKRIPVFAAIVLAVINPLKSMAVGPTSPGGPPAPILTGIIISGSESVDEETSIQYVCSGKYSDGTSAIITAAWSENSSNSSIDASGLFTASNVSSDEEVVITATYGTYSVSMDVTIKYLPPLLSHLEIIGTSILDEESSFQYSCIAHYSDGSSEQVDPVWSEDSANASVTASGLLQAGNVIVDEAVYLTADYSGKSVSMGITVNYVAPTLSNIEISGPTTVNEDASAQYTCTANYTDGTSLSVIPSWTVSTSSAGIDTTGKLTTGSVESDSLISLEANFNGKTDSYSVTITDIPAVLESLTIQGGVSMDENTSIQLNCIARYSDGSTPVVSPSWSIGSSYAQIDQDGLLRAGDVTADVGVKVSASFDGVPASHNVLIKYVAPVLERIEVAGPSVVAEGEVASYTCTAYYDDDSSETVDPEWSENSSYADVNSSGTLSTYDVQSDQSLAVSASYQGKSDSMQVSIQNGEPVLISLSISGATQILEGRSTDYTCEAAYSDGTSATVVPIWSVESVFAEINSAGTLTGLSVAKDEAVTVYADFGGLTESFAVTVMYEMQTVELTGLTIHGPNELKEHEFITFTCQASYSDGTVATVTPVWTDDSEQATIDTDGTLVAGNIDIDGAITITASYGGTSATHVIEVQMIGMRIVYPLSGFEGKTLKAELYDNEAEEWHDLGQFDSPEELVIQDVVAGQWYWVSIQEYNETSNTWNEVHAAWMHM